MEIAILLALILLNGAFAMSAIALVTARRTRLQKLVDEGDSAAAAAVKLGADPTRFLSTIRIGITSIGELLPKRSGQTHPEAFARLVARPIEWLAIATNRQGPRAALHAGAPAEDSA
jgi:putative hemolysin